MWNNVVGCVFGYGVWVGIDYVVKRGEEDEGRRGSSHFDH